MLNFFGSETRKGSNYEYALRPSKQKQSQIFNKANRRQLVYVNKIKLYWFPYYLEID